ncbi:hypothetical protein TWF718_001153 [Orbilia javanica]|uniref:Uncharacterized protein n=1 Tax=Orbilia javanica TaxID=47235 RepID=A0AAN8MUZ7_9PEZI
MEYNIANDGDGDDDDDGGGGGGGGVYGNRTYRRDGNDALRFVFEAETTNLVSRRQPRHLWTNLSSWHLTERP